MATHPTNQNQRINQVMDEQARLMRELLEELEKEQPVSLPILNLDSMPQAHPSPEKKP